MSWSRTIRWSLLIAAIGAAGYFGWDHYGRARPPQTAQKAPAGNPVPVKIATVEKADFPVYLTGLGTVTPPNTVTVKSRVDGQLMRVSFREGQVVKKGDLLAEIDPRVSTLTAELLTATSCPLSLSQTGSAICRDGTKIQSPAAAATHRALIPIKLLGNRAPGGLRFTLSSRAAPEHGSCGEVD